MLHALRTVAEHAPQLSGGDLVSALEATGWVDGDTARRLLPAFVHFDPDRHFADYVRSLSFRGRGAQADFRAGVRSIFDDLIGGATIDERGAEPLIRFASGELQGVALAHPEVSFTINGSTRDAVLAAAEEMPDTIVIVARNFEKGAAAHLSGLLADTEVPGTLVTVNLLLGIRAIALRYQPGVERVVRLLSAGRPIRSTDIATLGERVPAPREAVG